VGVQGPEEQSKAFEGVRLVEPKEQCHSQEDAAKKRVLQTKVQAIKDWFRQELKEQNGHPAQKEEEKHAYKAFITLDDRIGIEHLKSRNGERDEFQTTLLHPREFRKTLIRVFRLKGLRWSILRKHEDGGLARLPKPIQILEEDMEYVVRIEARKRKRKEETLCTCQPRKEMMDLARASTSGTATNLP
jgi:hypothetical protein